MVSEGDLIRIENAPFEFFQLSAMPVAEKVALKKKLQTELAHVRSAIENIGADFEKRSIQKHSAIAEDHVKIPENGSGGTVESVYCCDSNRQLCLSSEIRDTSMSKKRKMPAPEMNGRPKHADNCSSNEEVMLADKSEAASIVISGSKLSSPRMAGGPNQKGWRMDVSKARQCGNELKKLMNHPAGWVFNQPVDPKELNIPDYFSIISKPMDLGTIKHKLVSKQYLSTHEFAADVWLTFSNAMQYNAPKNEVHIMAKELNCIFNSRWKSLEEKWRKQSSVSSQKSVTKTHKQILPSRQVAQKKPACHSNSFPRRSLTSADKLKLRKELAHISIRTLPPRLLNFLQKNCLIGQVEDRIEVDIDTLDDDTVWELHEIMRSCADTRPMDSEEISKKCSQQPVQDLCKGNSATGLRCGGANRKVQKIPSVCMSGLCAGMNCYCIHHNDLTQALSSDVDSERSSGKEGDSCHSIAYNLFYEKTVGAQRGTPDSDPDGDGDLPCEEQLSPTKALRAVMLKSRFADTILKAQHKALLNHGEKVDPAKLQREREKLKKKQQEEKVRIEAQVKVAEVAARMKAEAELKMQREKEREAARLALQKMEKTVEIDNSHILKDLENLGYPHTLHHPDMPDEVVVDFMDGVELQSGIGNPLEQLGLFMKGDDLDEADDLISAAGNGDVEEGEIAGL